MGLESTPKRERGNLAVCPPAFPATTSCDPAENHGDGRQRVPIASEDVVRTSTRRLPGIESSTPGGQPCPSIRHFAGLISTCTDALPPLRPHEPADPGLLLWRHALSAVLVGHFVE